MRNFFAQNCILLAFAFVTSLAGGAVDNDAVKAIKLTPCNAVETGTTLCGKLAVFEDRKRKTGRKIDLNIVVLPSLTPNPIHPPLFLLDGGPGMPATKNADLFAGELKFYREGRDIVLVDQRGTGGSNPLHCTPVSTSPFSALDDMYPIEYVRNCRAKLEKHADLAQYTTDIAMDDLNDVRVGLGYPKIDLMGVSYGTRAVQVFVRRHGPVARKVVLMGAVSQNQKMPSTHAPDGQQAIDLLLQKCLADAECGKTFPDIRRDLESTMLRLRKRPQSVMYAAPGSSAQTKVEIRADIFAEQLRKWMYSRRSSQAIPFIINNAARGNFSPFLRRVIRSGSGPSILADGMYLSITCSEDVPFIDVAAASRAAKETIFGGYRILQQKRACDNWVRGGVEADSGRAESADITALIISGSLDPVTPPKWADEVAKSFRSHKHVIIPEHAHDPDGLKNLECMDGIVLAFLNDVPDAKINFRCISEMKPSPFLTSESGR